MVMPYTLVARLCTNLCCFLYPAYASYKALSLAPSSPEGFAQVERWLMYWAVVGTWTGTESVVGWTFTWLPFYSVIKAGVFLYLALPQSEGSSYIYRTHLAPLFHDHERDIDAFLNSLGGRASVALSGGIGYIWELVRRQLGGALPHQGQGAAPPGYDVNASYPTGIQQPPSFQDPASGAAQQAYGLFAKYAGQYMPVALTALSAVSGSARGQAAPGSRSVSESGPQGPQGPSTPIPGVNRQISEGNMRSRTLQQADQVQQQSPSQAQSQSGQSSAHSVASGFGGLGHRTSDESVTRLSSSNDMGSYEQIARDEAQGAPDAAGRPGSGNRKASWFGGWSSPEQHGKAE